MVFLDIAEESWFDLGAMKALKALFAVLIAALCLTVLSYTASAGSGTWKDRPDNGEWFDANNWTSGTVPNGPNDISTFGSSKQTKVTASLSPEINAMVFDPGASAFTFTVRNASVFDISGVGITNNGRQVQNFILQQDGFSSYGGAIHFSGNATAGNKTTFTLNPGYPGGVQSGQLYFLDSSNAGEANFVLQAGALSGAGGRIVPDQVIPAYFWLGR